MRRSIILLAAAALIVVAMPLPAAAAPVPVPVRANQDPGLGNWVSSGIAVTAGDLLRIRAFGTATTGPLVLFPGAISGPDGQPFSCPDPGGPAVGCALDGAPYGALIGKIGGTVFLVGSHFAGPAPNSGELMFAVNDNLGYSFDNRLGYIAYVAS